MKNDKQILKITVTHSDPEIEKKGAEAVRALISIISEAMGEKAEFFETEEEAKKKTDE